MNARNRIFQTANLVPIVTSIVLAVSSPCFGQTVVKPRVLRVAVYPFVPEIAQIELKIEQDFEASHPGVRLEFVDLGDYYGGGLVTVLTANPSKVDVVEVDTVFLQDLVDSNLIDPIPQEVLQPEGTYLPVATRAAVINNKTFGVPHWVCGNFLFFRKDDRDADRLTRATKLGEIEQILGDPTTEEQGLLADIRGKTTLGELYLSCLLDEYGVPKEALAHLGNPSALDSAAVKTPNRIFSLCPGGLNHNSKYHSNGQFYSRQFAHRKARAKISYSEDLYYVGDEFLHGVASDEPGVGEPAKDDIQAIGAPLMDEEHKMLAWVDVLCLRRNLTGEKKKDALAFITTYSGADFNRAILTPAPGDVPRYLLPARASLYGDLAKAAPLYPRLKEIIQDAVAITDSRLNQRLRDIGAELDKHVESP